MELLLTYIKQRRKGIIVFFLFCAVFLAAFVLYRLPAGAVLYPALLCGILGAAFLAADFYRVRKKHRKFLELQKKAADLLAALPEAESIGEADCQTVIAALREEIAELETRSSARYRDTVEYYTMWVHQIKTPITSMRLSLQNEDTPLSRKLSSDLFQIEQYVEMVLAFLRLDSPIGDYVFREHSVDAVVKQAVAKFASEFIDRKIRLEYEPINQTVITDEKWLSLVVEQILSNALKYTRQGGIKIYMREPKTLCVEDTGIGIAPEDLPRVFEKGYTGINGRRDRRASGIGLYLCKRICDNLGAQISIASVPDRGTTVSVDLAQYPLKSE